MQPLPADFTGRMIALYGQRGAAWLDHLPALLGECARRWSLTIGPPFGNLSYNYVAPAARADGSPAVIKLGVPNPELLTEIAALRHYDGHGIVKLLDADPDQGIMLLERLTPGALLLSVADDERATLIAAQVMRQLWRPPPPDAAFPTVARWAEGVQRLRAEFGGSTGPFPRRLVEEAEALFADLLGSMAAPALLHGDLHHENIMSAERAPWLALDPKGVVGEPAYEVGALLRNPLPRLLAAPDPGRVQARRVALLAEALDFERARIRGWGLAQAVLSAWWSYEDGDADWRPAITCAELLSTLKA